MTLILLKVLSNGLTALAGIFGLLTEFKDERKRITSSGKLALVGIVVGFALSCLMTYEESRQTAWQAAAHAREVRRLSRPLHQLAAQMTLSDPAERSPQNLSALAALKDWLTADDRSVLLISQSSLGRDYHAAQESELPGELRSKLSFLDVAGSLRVTLYPRGAVCSAAGIAGTAALELAIARDAHAQAPRIDPLEEDADAVWRYVDAAQRLTLTRVFPLQATKDAGMITSIDDLPGATVGIAVDGPFPRHPSPLNVEAFKLTAGPGVEFAVPAGKLTAFPRKVPPRDFFSRLFHRDEVMREYCYTFPEATAGP
jgi:hypothetical protein